MTDNPHRHRHPTLIYWTSADGTVRRVESRNADRIDLRDELFRAPFTDNRILGCNLFQFIEGPEVSHIYRALATRVIETGRTIAFPYRCDSPGVRRDMNMELSRDGETVRYESTMLREIAREIEIPNDTPGSATFVAICSFCKNYRFPAAATAWKELEMLLLEKELPAEFSLSHGVCDTCYRLAMKELM